jgi:hypothetical protein
MPAPSSSLIVPAIGHLAELMGDAAEDPRGLLTMLAGVADPRGVRHRLLAILGLAVCAVLGGAGSFTAIAEWAADADQETLARLGVTGTVPSESTFRRTLQRLDAGAFDDLAGEWAPRPHRTRAGWPASDRGGRQDLTRLRSRRPAQPPPAGGARSCPRRDLRTNGWRPAPVASPIVGGKVPIVEGKASMVHAADFPLADRVDSDDRDGSL